MLDYATKLLIFVPAETFIKVYERNYHHILFQWFNDLANDYKGNVNG